MFNFRLRCPHCLNEESFSIASVSHYSGAAPIAIAHVPHGAQRNFTPPLNPVRSYSVAMCPRPLCGGPVLIWFEISNPMLAQQHHQAQGGVQFVSTGQPPKVLGTWPSVPVPDDSENWPEKLREVFREVQEDVKARRNPARIVSTCRSVLEVALAALGYPKSRDTLQARIDKAQADGVITKGMAEWAKKIRIDGNDAIHELIANHQDAQDLVNYIRTFLDIAFDLPERIKAFGSSSAPTP